MLTVCLICLSRLACWPRHCVPQIPTSTPMRAREGGIKGLRGVLDGVCWAEWKGRDWMAFCDAGDMKKLITS